MNIDDIKSDWRGINITYTTADTGDVESRVMGNKVASLGRQLFRINMRLVAVCCLGISLFIPFGQACPALMWLAIGYFVIMAIILLLQARAARKINICEMTVVEAINAVCRLERDRVIKRYIGLCMAIPLLAYMTYILYLAHGPNILYGCLAGAVAGAVIGILINRKATTILRDMKAALDA